MGRSSPGRSPVVQVVAGVVTLMAVAVGGAPRPRCFLQCDFFCALFFLPERTTVMRPEPLLFA